MTDEVRALKDRIEDIASRWDPAWRIPPHDMCVQHLLRSALAVSDTQPKCDNPSGEYCKACRETGMYHCSDPDNCGGMQPMRHHDKCRHAAPLEPKALDLAGIAIGLHTPWTVKHHFPCAGYSGIFDCDGDEIADGYAWPPGFAQRLVEVVNGIATLRVKTTEETDHG